MIKCNLRCDECKYLSVFNPEFEINEDKKIKICDKTSERIFPDDILGGDSDDNK